ncbi:uncharacterized protein [Rutidosis leptorrhynchoides]|uniref:uncharacterized protein n=1 Tax=Rutidosis leptorrhynchoides TaxID=125765 RepID=UPI003A99FC7C
MEIVASLSDICGGEVTDLIQYLVSLEFEEYQGPYDVLRLLCNLLSHKTMETSEFDVWKEVVANRMITLLSNGVCVDERYFARFVNNLCKRIIRLLKGTTLEANVSRQINSEFTRWLDS